MFSTIDFLCRAFVDVMSFFKMAYFGISFSVLCMLCLAIYLLNEDTEILNLCVIRRPT